MPSLEALPGLRAEPVRTGSALERLRPDWGALWARAPGAPPFLSPDWLIPWWRHIGEGELLTLAVRDGEDGLVGVVPLYVYTLPGGGERVLFPLGIATPTTWTRWSRRGTRRP